MHAYTMFLAPEPEVIVPVPDHPVQRGFIPAFVRPAPTNIPPVTTTPAGKFNRDHYRETPINLPPRRIRVRPQSNPPGYRPHTGPVRVMPIFTPPPSPSSSISDADAAALRRSDRFDLPEDIFLVNSVHDGEPTVRPVQWWPLAFKRDGQYYRRACETGEPWAAYPEGPTTTPVLAPKTPLPATPALSAGSSSSVSTLGMPLTPETPNVALMPESPADEDEWELVENEDDECAPQARRAGLTGNTARAAGPAPSRPRVTVTRSSRVNR